MSRYTQWAWVAAPLLMVASVPVVSAHAVALSEPLFLLLGLAGLFLLAKYLETDRRKWLVTGALSLGLALLARYAGAALLLTGGLAILLFARHAVGRRVRDAALFSVLASLPMLVWLARNLAVGGSGTGRELAFHPMTKAHVWQAVYTVSSWFLVPPAAPNVVRLMVCASVAGALAYVLGPVNRNPPAPAVVRVLSLFVVAYAAFLVASLSFFDANTPLDDRILLPAYVAIVIVLLYLFDRFWGAVRGHRLAIPAAMVLALFVGAHAIRGAGGIANGYAAGWGFTGAAWRDSATLAEVRRLPASARIFSNAPEAIYLHTGRTADGLPRKVYLMTAEANRGFAGELQAVGAELERSCGVLVYFRRLSAQKSVPGEGEIRARLSLSPRTDKEDGVILSPAACR